VPRKDVESRRAYHRDYMRDWYAKEENKKAHKARVAANNRKRTEEVKAKLALIKSGPCADCGRTYPVECMDFDHLRDKFMDIGRMRTHSWATVEKELAKCELVCSNCHRVRTAARRAGVVE
jgi:hypothetical protein